MLVVTKSTTVFTQTSPEIVIPNFNDKYSQFIKNLEAGETDINYKEFRESFVESEQFKIASKESKALDSLKKEIYVHMSKPNHKELISITKQMLSIDYTSMIAHKILRQTYQLIGDTLNAKKYKTIQFGPLNSIVKNGDGRTCQTAWPVIQIEEEYFILQMLGAKLNSQSMDNTGGLCDKMQVEIDGENKTYYFETSKIFEGYKKLGFK